MATRSSVSSVKKATSTAEAPIWKSYLAIRSDTSTNAGNAVDNAGKGIARGNGRGRKRAKPSTSRENGAAIWVVLAARSGKEDGAVVLKNIRHYWEQLSVNERQQILFLDEPELVKQLYKLNLSLLCVGLMQRHLKTPSRTASDPSTTNTKSPVASTATATPKDAHAPTTLASQAATIATTPSTRAATDTSSEKTYELLEAMEFMDIGTGILTVKTELAEDTDRLFTLVGDVLAGFLTSIHVLTGTNFNKLFVTESETINTWANYQRLIAMLVEQLILRSYVSHLEKEAAQQMEQLLLEVSLEDKETSATTSASVSHTKKKSKKKKKKKKSVARAFSNPQQNETADEEKPGNTVDRSQDYTDFGDTVELQSIEAVGEEPVPEPICDFVSITADNDCQRTSSRGSIDTVALDLDEVMPAELETRSKTASGLNPYAIVFQPQEHVPIVHGVDERIPFSGKRKFDEYIVSVPWEDVASDEGSTFDSPSVDGDDSEAEDEDKGDNQRWRKQRRREEDAELEWQLQQVYASTSSLLGWDFSRQCELPDPAANLPWSESTLWKTAPKEVVRYFSPGHGNSFSSFQAPHFLPPAGPPPSRYYFNPGPPMQFGPPFLPPPGMDPRSLHSGFDFPPSEFPMVADFTNAQYPSPEDQVDF